MTTPFYPIGQGQPDVMDRFYPVSLEHLFPNQTHFLDVFRDFDYAEQNWSKDIDPIIPHNALRETTPPTHAPAPSWQHATPAKKILQEWHIKLEDQNEDKVDTSLKDGIDSCKSLPSGSITADHGSLYTFALEQFKDHPENLRGDRCDACYTLERECKRSDVGGPCQSCIEAGWPQQTAKRKAQRKKSCIACSKLKLKCIKDYIGGQCHRCARLRLPCESRPTKFRWMRPNVYGYNRIWV